MCHETLAIFLYCLINKTFCENFILKNNNFKENYIIIINIYNYIIIPLSYDALSLICVCLKIWNVEYQLTE